MTINIKQAKPCPFCGGTALNICATEYEAEKRQSYAVSCRTVKCHGGVFTLGHGDFKTAHAAVTAWNDRN